MLLSKLLSLCDGHDGQQQDPNESSLKQGGGLATTDAVDSV